MMLLIARAATWRLSTGLKGLYGWCRFSDHETWPPCLGVIGSRPSRPVLVSLKYGLPPLVTRAKTHRTERVAGAQAKLTWVGSDRTSGFWQAREIWLWMVATDAGQDGPLVVTFMNTRTATITASSAMMPIFSQRDAAGRAGRPGRPGIRDRAVLCRPRFISVSVRQSASRSSSPDRPCMGPSASCSDSSCCRNSVTSSIRRWSSGSSLIRSARCWPLRRVRFSCRALTCGHLLLGSSRRRAGLRRAEVQGGPRAAGRAAGNRATQQRGLRNRRRLRDYGHSAAALVDLGTDLLEHMYESEVKR